MSDDAPRSFSRAQSVRALSKKVDGYTGVFLGYGVPR